MAAFSELASPIASRLERLRAWRSTRRKSSADFLALAAVTVALFGLLLLGFDAAGGSALVGRMFGGSLSARTQADYGASFSPRVKPLRPNAGITGTSGTSGTSGTNGAARP